MQDQQQTFVKQLCLEQNWDWENAALTLHFCFKSTTNCSGKYPMKSSPKSKVTRTKANATIDYHTKYIPSTFSPLSYFTMFDNNKYIDTVQSNTAIFDLINLHGIFLYYLTLQTSFNFIKGPEIHYTVMLWANKIILSSNAAMKYG